MVRWRARSPWWHGHAAADAQALHAHAQFAVHWLEGAAPEISGLMRKYQLALADRQARMAEVSGRVQDAIIMLCTSLYAVRQTDELVHQAADCLCQELTRKPRSERPSDRYYRSANRLGAAIADGGFAAIAGTAEGEILMPYANDA